MADRLLHPDEATAITIVHRHLEAMQKELDDVIPGYHVLHSVVRLSIDRADLLRMTVDEWDDWQVELLELS